jgi:hypothetical protein
MTRTTLKRPRIKCTDYGDFSVHFGDGVANIYNKVTRAYVVIKKENTGDSWLNSYQYFLFRRCLFGLEVYSQEEMRYISSQKKKRILAVHKHAMEVINVFKQKLLTEKTNKILGKLLPNSKSIQVFISVCNETDPEFDCSIPLEKLGACRMDIAKELVVQKCLPYNFWDLTLNDDPRMIKLKAPQEPLDKK